jgi:hypothetical protein
MKLLYVHGDDYAALTFEQTFKGRNCIDFINDPETAQKEFLAKNPEYGDEFHIEVFDAPDLTEETFNFLRDAWGDYDYMKTGDVYTEDHKFGDD